MLSNTSPEITFPKIILLPNGWQPEGITSGSGMSFYIGSLANGAIYAGDFGTGTGSVLVPGQPGLMSMGMDVDKRSNALFVAGGVSGQGRVYDASTGALLRTYQFQDMSNATPLSTLINDVIVTREAAYFTDSFSRIHISGATRTRRRVARSIGADPHSVEWRLRPGSSVSPSSRGVHP